MKTNISEFTSHEELDEFFENPLIDDEIELREDEARKIEWEKIIELLIREYINVNKVKIVNISYAHSDKLNFEVIYFGRPSK